MAFKALEDLIAALTRRVQRAELRVTMAAPAGVVQPYAGVTLPDGWLWADGGTYDPDVYPALYAAIGTSYGGTPEAPLLPNLTGRVPVGLDAGDADLDTAGNTGGEKEHTLNRDEIPTPHFVDSDGTDVNISNLSLSTATSGRMSAQGNYAIGGLDQLSGGSRFTGASSWNDDVVPTHLRFRDGLTDNADPIGHNNMQPYIALPYLIKT